MSMVPELVARHLRGAPNAVQEEAGTSPERGEELEDGEDEDHGR
jgi:hypothetical protein